MGFFDDVDIESVNKKKNAEVNEDEKAESLSTDNLLDDLMPTDEEDAEDNIEDAEDDDMDDMFPEMPVEYDDSADDDDMDNITEPIENEPVYETPKSPKSQTESDTKTEPLVKKDQGRKSGEQFPIQKPKEKVPVRNSVTNVNNNSRNVILDGTTIFGSIQSVSPLDIYGHVDGSVESTEDILIGETASVSDFVTTQKNAVINGDIGNNIIANSVSVSKCKVKGNIMAHEIELKENSIVIGNVSSSGNVIIHGAVKGDIDAKEKVEVSETAIIQGNIKSAIISIAPGAAIDGTCTQEYAKVKPSDFFADIE